MIFGNAFYAMGPSVPYLDPASKPDCVRTGSDCYRSPHRLAHHRPGPQAPHCASRICAMALLTPDPNHIRPTSAQARDMCQQITFEIRPLVDLRLVSVLERLRDTHVNGGALFASFDVGPNKDFDWFASREQLSIFGILRLLLDRAEIREAMPSLEIEPARPDDPAFLVRKLGDLGPVDPGLAGWGVGIDSELPNTDYDGEFRLKNPFIFDGELASKLYQGGAYTHGEGDGRTEKQNALTFCGALFGLGSLRCRTTRLTPLGRHGSGVLVWIVPRFCLIGEHACFPFSL